MECSCSNVVYIFCNFLFLFLPLSQRFSCIIGPNGSGKSNVIDSMLFVFGYRAQKIRSKKLSVLIHSSDKHKDVESCTVEVHFQKIIDKVYRYIFFSLFCHFTLHTPHSVLKWSMWREGEEEYFKRIFFFFYLWDNIGVIWSMIFYSWIWQWQNSKEN